MDNRKISDLRAYDQTEAVDRAEEPRALREGVAKEKSAIMATVDNLSETLDVLHDTISVLEARLHIVSTPVPQDEAVRGIEARGNSQLAHMLASTFGSAQLANSRVREVISNLEV